MLLTRNLENPLRIFEPEVKRFFTGKSVLLLGSAQSVTKVKAEFMDKFDVIVRVNNYQHFNSCTRTDVFYSMMGGSIMKTSGDLRRDGVKFIFCKNPFRNVIVRNKDGSINHLQSQDCREPYVNTRNTRIRWFELPYYLQTLKNWLWITGKINKVVTTGLAAIVDIYRYNPYGLHIAGFDFFSSGFHNINIPCHIKPWPKHHDFKGEMLFARSFVAEHGNISIDDTLKKIFDEPDKFPKIGNKPE
jgi:hypothetical protein